MKKEIIFLVEEDIEGGFNAMALGLPIFTQGDTIEQVKKNIQDALQCHFDKEEDIPRIIRLHIVKEEVIADAPATCELSAGLGGLLRERRGAKS